MSARFAELMALSASKTRETNAATEQLLAEKKRKEEQRLKEQQARDAREREMRAALVRRRLEEAQRAEERQRRQEEERARKEAVLARREEQLRLNLIYGKDKRSALGSSSSSGSGSRGRKGKSGDDDGDENEIGSSVLTREEKRMRRLNNDLNRSFTSKRKDAPYSSVNSNSPRRPGGGRSSGHDVIEAQKGSQTSGSAADDASSRQSLRKQLTSMPQQLIKLNTVKRDTRTIDEIMNDLQRAKDQRVIAGEDARGFKDWFASKEKEKEKEREKERKETGVPVPANTSKKARSWSRSPSEEPHVADTGRRAKSAVRSMETGATSSGRSTPSAPKPPERKEPRTKVTIIKPEPRGSIDFQKTSRVYSEAPKPSTNLSSKQQAVRSATSLADRSNTSRPTKRKRSYSPESLYDSDNLDDDDRYDDYGARGRGRSSSRAARPKNDISSEIWRLFGKDRDRYVQNDVYSDEDDDMEVDADALRREELRSERLAKREDEAALEEERRHEEAKRRKKLMKDRK